MRARSVLLLLIGVLLLSTVDRAYASPACATDAWRLDCDSINTCRADVHKGLIFPHGDSIMVKSRASYPFVMLANRTNRRHVSLVLVHGLSASAENLRSLAENYRNQGYDVVAPLLTGHGGAPTQLAARPLKDCWKKDVRRARDLAIKLNPRVEGVGHSTGAALLVEYALAEERQPFAKLRLYDPALNFNTRLGLPLKHSCLSTTFIGFTGTVLKLLGSVRAKLERFYLFNNLSRLRHFDPVHLIEVQYPEACGGKLPFARQSLHDSTEPNAICELSRLQMDIQALSLHACERLPLTELVLSRDRLFWSITNKPELMLTLCSPRQYLSISNTTSTFHTLLPFPSCQLTEGVDKN